MHTSLALVLLLLYLAFFGACKKQPQAEPEGYRVVSYDSATAQYVIIRTGTFDGKRLRKRMTVICDFYKWGDHEPVIASHACDLRVGELIVPHHAPDADGSYANFVDVFEMSPDRLSIDQGDGPNQVNQQFVVVKNEVLPDDH
jgi:hypothetical protein